MELCIKLIGKIKIFILIFILLFSFQVKSEGLRIDEFYKLTLQEAIEYSESGNPIDVFLDFKKQNGGEVDGSYGDYVGTNGDGYYWELEEKVDNITNAIEDKIDKGEEEIKKEIKQEENNSIIEYIKKNIIKIILLILCIILIILSITLLKNKIVIIVSSVLIIVLSINLFIGINKKNEIIESLNNNENETMAIKKIINEIEGESKEIKTNDFEYMSEEEYIKKLCDKKYDISGLINDYILKVYYCIRQKAHNKKIYYNELYEVFSEVDIDKEREYVKKEELLDRNTFLDNDPFDYGMNVKTISFDEMEYIYNNITNEDIESFNNGTFVKKLIDSVDQSIKWIDAKNYKNKNILLSSYLVKKIGSRKICKNFFAEDILKVLKDWYIEENETIELPFNVKINFEKQKFIEKDIKEIIGTNKNDDSLIIYYKDSNGNIKGDFLLNDYIDDNGSFNKSEIMYNIKRPILTMDVIGFEPYYNYEDIDVYDENGNYLVIRDKSEDIRDNMSYGTNRDNELEYILSTGNKNGFGFNITIDSYNFTENFIKKFGSDYLIFKDFNIKNSKLIPISKSVAKTDKLIRKLILEDGTEKICIFKVIWTDNYEVDDILTYIVPEDKMNLSYEEMYQLAFND